jgi:hypothetical protein
MDGYIMDMESGVVEKAEKLEEVGWEEYGHVIDAEGEVDMNRGLPNRLRGK